MSTLKRIPIPAAILLAGLLTLGPAANAIAQEVRDLRARFTSSLQTIEQAHTNRLALWNDEYIRALNVARRRAMAEGRERDIPAFDAERARVAGGADRAPFPVSAPADLAALHAEAEALWVRLQRQRHEEVLALAEKYAGVLEDLERRHHAANRPEMALALREERERAWREPAVLAADFGLALLEWDAPATPANVVTSPPAASPVAAPAVAAGPAPRKPDIRVYRPGDRVPTEDASAYRSEIVTRTDHGPLATPIAATILNMARSETKKEGDAHRRETILKRQHYRLQLRTLPAAGAVDAPTVVIQFFIKDAQSKGRIDSESFSVQRVDLERLTPEVTTIDFAPVETLMVRQRHPSGVWHSSGKDWYGAIISVFDPNENLLYQTTTVRGLNAEARPEIPRPPLRETLEQARLAMEAARRAENEARMNFFRNQRDETSQRAMVEATRLHEEARLRYLELRQQAEAQKP